jgi:6-phosphofructokinase 1
VQRERDENMIKHKNQQNNIPSELKGIVNGYGKITTERILLLKKRDKLYTKLDPFEPRDIPNPLDQEKVGIYRSDDKRKCVTADMEIIEYFTQKLKCLPPSFMEAGPKEKLYFDPKEVRIGIVTPGGIAPGLNTVIHCIVNMHTIYGMTKPAYGILGGFRGIAEWRTEELTATKTKNLINQGGTYLCTSREEQDITRMANNLKENGVNILYVVGGDGSLTAAHLIAQEIKRKEIKVNRKKIVIAGIPKTMDNDILWVWNSFGFNTAVEEATKAINAIYADAKSTERICIMQLFGRDAGFVAAHASLASGQADAVLIPEVDFKIEPLIEYIQEKLVEQNYALIVVAEGACPREYSEDFIHDLLKKEGYDRTSSYYRTIPRVNEALAEGKLIFLREKLKEYFNNYRQGRHVVFVSQPRHLLRAVPPNSVDQTYCQRLADLAVHSALAGFNDFMISQWLTEYVLVPLKLIAEEMDPNDPIGKKRKTKKIPPSGIFWATVISSTGQPSFI